MKKVMILACALAMGVFALSFSTGCASCPMCSKCCPAKQSMACCPKCGQQAGSAACCKAGATKCAKCGLDAGSPGCMAKCCPKAEAAK
ncbi:MAG: hypothetical protein KJ579_08165 [Verrucomicrobia bacterium]|nr:hypothetical protein [Verrucomicrobiota bacterium]